MFLIDDILLAPIKGFLAVCNKIKEIAEEEMEDTPEKLKKELLDLQMLLEAGQISEKQHLKKEKNILERLSALQKELKT